MSYVRVSESIAGISCLSSVKCFNYVLQVRRAPFTEEMQSYGGLSFRLQAGKVPQHKAFMQDAVNSVSP